MVDGHDHGSEGYGFISLENIALPAEDERQHTTRCRVVMGSYPLRAFLPLYFQ